MKKHQEFIAYVIVLLGGAFAVWLPLVYFNSIFWSIITFFLLVVTLVYMSTKAEDEVLSNRSDVKELESQLVRNKFEFAQLKKEYDALVEQHNRLKLETTDTIASLKARCSMLQKKIN